MNERQETRLNLLHARFMEWMEARNYSPRTRPDYDRYVRDFLGWIIENAFITSIAEVSAVHVQQYQLTLCQPVTHDDGSPGRMLSVSAQICRLAAIKTFFSWLTQTQQIACNPAASIEPPKQPERLPRDILSQDEARLMLESTPVIKPLDIRDRAILETLYGTAIRRAELLALTIYDADLQSATIRIEKGKGGRSRLLPLTAGACAALRLYLAESRSLYATSQSGATMFISSRSGQPLSDNDILRIVRKAAKRARIEKRATPHTLRHSCATHLLQERADIRQIQKLLGHKRLSTTEIYTRVEISDLQEVISRCHPRENHLAHENGYADEKERAA